jgi:hypothetical protein
MRLPGPAPEISVSFGTECVAAGRPEQRNRRPIQIAIPAESLKWAVDVNCGANTKKDRG